MTMQLRKSCRRILCARFELFAEGSELVGRGTWRCSAMNVESDETEACVWVVPAAPFDVVPGAAHPELVWSRTSERAEPDRSRRSRRLSIGCRDLRRLTRLQPGSRA